MIVKIDLLFMNFAKKFCGRLTPNIKITAFFLAQCCLWVFVSLEIYLYFRDISFEKKIGILSNFPPILVSIILGSLFLMVYSGQFRKVMRKRLKIEQKPVVDRQLSFARVMMIMTYLFFLVVLSPNFVTLFEFILLFGVTYFVEINDTE